MTGTAASPTRMCCTRPSAGCTRAASRSSLQPPTRAPVRRATSPPPTTRSSRSRPSRTPTASRAAWVGIVASRGAHTTWTTRSPTSATSARMSTSSLRANASGRQFADPATGTHPGRRWRRRPSRVRSRSTRRAARGPLRPKCARHSDTSATSVGRPPRTRTASTSRCLTCTAWQRWARSVSSRRPRRTPPH